MDEYDGYEDDDDDDDMNSDEDERGGGDNENGFSRTTDSKSRIVQSTLKLPRGSIDTNLMFMKLVIVFRAFNKEYIFLPEMYLPSLARNTSSYNRRGEQSKLKTLPLVCQALYFDNKTFTSNDKKLEAQGFTYPTLKILLEGTTRYPKLKYLIQHLSTKRSIGFYNNIKLMEMYLEKVNELALDESKKKEFLKTFWLQYFHKIVESNVGALLKLFFKRGQILAIEPNQKLKVEGYTWDKVTMVGSISKSKFKNDRSRMEVLFAKKIEKRKEKHSTFLQHIISNRKKSCPGYVFKTDQNTTNADNDEDAYLKRNNSFRRNESISREFINKYGKKPTDIEWDEYINILYDQINRGDDNRTLFCKQLQAYDKLSKSEQKGDGNQEDMIFVYVDVTFSNDDLNKEGMSKRKKQAEQKKPAWFNNEKCIGELEQLKKDFELLFIDYSNTAFKDEVVTFSTFLMQKGITEPNWMAEIRATKKIHLTNATASRGGGGMRRRKNRTRKK